MRPIRKILFATRFGNLTYSSLERLLPWREAGLEEVVLLHVVPRDEVGFVPYGGFDKELARDMKQKAHLEFADWGAALTARGIAWKEIEEVGAPSAKILEVSEREAVDLIVVGRSVTDAADEIYPTGVDMDTLRDAEPPVLVMGNPTECEGRGLFEHVLVPTDFTTAVEGTFLLLQTLAKLVGRVSLLHVVEPGEGEEANRAALAALAGRVGALGLPVETHLLAGDVTATILACATERHATAIFLGTRRKRGLAELFGKSVSHRVAEHSPLPVLSLPG